MHHNTPLNAAPSFIFRANYPVDLDAVQLLLPLQDVLHAVHPHVDVPHQDRLAHVLNKTAQRDVERLQQLLDGTDVLLVVEDCERKEERSSISIYYYSHEPMRDFKASEISNNQANSQTVKYLL